MLFLSVSKKVGVEIDDNTTQCAGSVPVNMNREAELGNYQGGSLGSNVGALPGCKTPVNVTKILFSLVMHLIPLQRRVPGPR